MNKTAVIIGAGPAGLTAALELLKSQSARPLVFEASAEVGGLSRTVNFKGNRIDIGGHRFFSKSSRVMEWWRDILPIQGAPSSDQLERLNGSSSNLASPSLVPGGPDPEKTDLVMLVRKRLSRIFYLRRFFDYPVSLSSDTIAGLGARRVVRIGLSYLRSRLAPIRNESSLEDFLTNRFGKELYLTFFKDYTEKVWGVPCREIDPSWGAQRIKGLSVSKVLAHAITGPLRSLSANSIHQKNTETSLIEQFLYPKHGPGQMWEQVAKRVCELGGELHLRHTVVGVRRNGNQIVSVTVQDSQTGVRREVLADYVFSTMPVKDLIACFGEDPPVPVTQIADGLVYRDFMTVGLLLRQLKLSNPQGSAIRDNWIYVQEPDVMVGRIQFFNNWSPYMVRDPATVWIGLEYFVQEGDALWSKTDEAMAQFATAELASIGVLDPNDVLDFTVIRVPKTYPAYFGTYGRFRELREYLDQFGNLFLIGRNGMHRYNNQDHSMLSAMMAVENVVKGCTTKDNIWAVNAEQDYHEEK